MSEWLVGSCASGIAPTQYLKISCGCKNTPPAEPDSYKLEVVGGY